MLVCNARSGAFSTVNAPPNTLGVLCNAKSVVVGPGNASPLVQLSVDSTWLACHTFTRQASATGPDGTVTNLTMLVGTNVLGSFTNGTSRVITLSYDGVGETTFTAQATDNKGAMGVANVSGTITTLPLLTLDPIDFQTNRAFKLCMAGEAGTNCQVLASTNLTTTHWTVLGTMENTNSIWRFADATATNSAQHCYRARQLP